MKIIRKNTNSRRFVEIEYGQCFVINTDIDAVYMRMKIVNSEYTYAAVDLTTGQIYAFDRDTIVTPIKAKVEIE